MERRADESQVSPADETIPIDPERTVIAPRFDRKSVQSARPAVPLGERLKGRRPAGRSAAFVLLCVVAGVAGGLLGAFVLSRQQGDARPSANAEATPAPKAADAMTSQTSNAEQPPAATQATPEAATPSAQIVQDEGPDAAAGDEEAATPPDADSQATLRGALEGWVAATNARDISKQMSFYNARVNAFYLARNTSREAVRAEKSRVLGRAETVEVQAGDPDIRLSPDGQTAVMRFRKKYAISGGVPERRGEVLQELRWRRTRDGWKIVSERDLRVLQ